ncbi:3-(methylthio)propionyl-CoA ligase [Comamonas badia]|uniref:3-(methylthio)propionyl-CoA ligase n=1 Tax=Comamonas badia TaxID=265291 RepID=UPI00041A2B86|nr:3-(methylthio)propionyl-CoA ligase [Comamonas badia]
MNALMGRMMQMPLLISALITHAARHHAETEIVSRLEDGRTHRYTYRDAELRSRQLAQALGRLGTEPGDRIATLAWNGHRHFEIYFGASGSGRVCHTINPRLFPEQITWIVNHAQDRVLCFDLSFLPLIEKIAPQLASVRHFVALCERAQMPGQTTLANLQCYEDLVGAEDGHYAWPSFDENTASGICYTSGTTGNPKGAVYSHRSTLLHALAASLPDTLNLSAQDTILPVVPMYHVNAWGIPYSAALVGCKLVLPGPHLDGQSLYELFEAEGVTMAAGVPTVWLAVLGHIQDKKLKFSTLQRLVFGGSAAPPSMMKTFQRDYGVDVIHCWGMTEMSPLGTFARLKNGQSALGEESQRRILQKQGRAIFGVDMAILGDDGQPLPWDGEQSGNLIVRGPWVIAQYFGHDDSPLIDVGGQRWFPTGDVATIDVYGGMQITDRSKDVIKSGGEWISSIELENIAMAHPAVHEAAVIGCKHPKWDERPLLVVVKKPGTEVTREALLDFFNGQIAKWQIPDDVAFVDEIPHTATGKIQKLTLRKQFADYRLPTA